MDATGVTVTFALERFTWAAPDRLEVAGTFAGLPDEPPGAPVLVLQGAHATHRLPSANADQPRDGRPWRASFAWQEAPEAFDAARLELGDGVQVDLPAPGAQDGPAESGAASAESRDAPLDSGDRVRLEAELLAAREEARAARAEAQQAAEELERLRRDLEAERARRADDTARFREGLEKLQQLANETIATERANVELLRERLTAVEANEKELTALRAERAQSRGHAEAVRAEAEGLLARLVALQEELGDGRPGDRADEDPQRS
jgi:hypothetical protein